MVVSSTAFENNGMIPQKYTGFGDDLSPELIITDVPKEAVSFAIIFDDLDVPLRKTFTHWIIWNIPLTDVIPEGLPCGSVIREPISACQGIAWGKHRYRGPKQPFFIRKEHRYVFTVYALDCRLDISEQSRKKDLIDAMHGHIEAEARLIGRYQRDELRKKMKKIIETERLIITEFTPDMAQVVQENSMDDDNRRFVPDEVWETVEEAEETLEFLISQYGSFDGPLVYPIIVKETRDNIGYVELCPIDNGNWEIGYHIAKKYTGCGYATEAVNAFLPVIAKRAGISEIYGICLAENTASLAVMKKCGFENLFTGIDLYQGAEQEIVKNVWRVKK